MILGLDVFHVLALVPFGEGLRGDLESNRSSIAILVRNSLLIHPEQAFICDKPAPLIQVLKIPNLKLCSQPFLVMVKLVESFLPLGPRRTLSEYPLGAVGVDGLLRACSFARAASAAASTVFAIPTFDYAIGVLLYWGWFLDVCCHCFL